MIWLCMLLMLLPQGAGAQGKARKRTPQKKMQAPAAKPDRWPIEVLTVEGNHRYTAEQVLAVAGLRRGQIAGKVEFEAARDRLVATGAFETVGYRFAPTGDRSGFAAVFEIVEAEPAYPVRFEDLGVTDKELGAWLKGKDPLFGQRVPASKAVLDRYTRWIEELLASRHRKEKVTAVLTPSKADEFVVVFRPARPQARVAQISFEGNQVIPSSALQHAISDVAVGSAYSENRMRQLLDNAIRPLYEARGRLRVSFPKVVSEPAKDVQGVAVTVTVDEGTTYDLGSVQITGAAGFERADLLKAAAFKTGDLANFDEVNAGVSRLKKLMRRNGYMRVETSVDRKIDDAKKTVDLVIHIDEGAQFLFGTLHIEGLDIHGEAVIKRLWAIKEGKPFDADYPDFFLNRVREDGIFDNLGKTRSAAKVDEQARTVDVTLYFNR